VQAGDVIGLYTEAGDFYADTSSQADRVAAGPLGEQPVGTSTSYTPDRFAQLDGRYAVGAILDVSAQVEPDVDADGFGDVSQDACPGVAGSVQGCPHADLSVTQSASAASLLAGGPVTYALRVANGGPDAAPRVVVTESLPAGARLVSAIASTGTCSGTTTLSCDVGALATGADATVTVTVALPSPGTTVSTARVDSPTLDADQATAPGSGDTNAGNNTATATVTVTPAPSGGGGVPAPSPARPTMPPFAGVTLRAQTITLTRGTAQAPLFSPVAAAGRLTLSTTVTVPAPAREARGHKHRSRRKTVVVGVASFALVAGKLTLVPVHLTHAAMALLSPITRCRRWPAS
jgi:uncharacterized repeat protein (TIGR01451 family)